MRNLWRVCTVNRFPRPLLRNPVIVNAVARQMLTAETMPLHTDQKPRSRAVVRNVPDDNNLFVFLTLAGKTQNLNRPKDEPLEKALGRLRAKAMPAVSKRDKRKRQGPGKDESEVKDEAPAIPVALFSDCEGSIPVDPSQTNVEAWPQGRVLQVGQEAFDVVYNPPMIDKIELVKRAIVGYPILAMPQVLFADKEATTYRWLRRKPGGEAWEDVGCSSALYTPAEVDLGCALRVECVPGLSPAAPSSDGDTGCSRGAAADGPTQCAVGELVSADTAAVELGPEMPCGVLRAPQPLPATSSPDFRIASYNILADQYAGSSYAQKVLFNYCPPQFLDPEYRKQLVLAELARYNPDVFCLQEVDEKAFHEYLLPHLQLSGYTGRYTNKMGKVKEGSATFWRVSRFTEMARHDVLLRNVFKEPLDASHAHWQTMLDASPELRKALQKVTTIAQVTVLAPATQEASAQEDPICVVNTHLFFHPYAPHIRSMHTAAILEEACALVARLALPAPALLFCGDLNSDLNDGIPGVIELLQKGRLPADHWDWEQGAAFKWGMDEEEGTQEQQAAAPKPPGGKLAAVAGSGPASATASEPSTTGAAAAAEVAMHPGYDTASDEPSHSIAVVGADVQLPCGSLCSADDLRTPFSNYTSGYKALLDYVWYEPARMEVLQQVRMPSEEELGSFIPSQRFHQTT